MQALCHSSYDLACMSASLLIERSTTHLEARVEWQRRRSVAVENELGHHTIAFDFKRTDLAKLSVEQLLAIQFIPHAFAAEVDAAIEILSGHSRVGSVELAIDRLPKLSVDTLTGTTHLPPPTNVTRSRFDARLLCGTINDPAGYTSLLRMCTPNTVAFLKLGIQYVPLPVYELPQAGSYNDYTSMNKNERPDTYLSLTGASKLKRSAVRPVLITEISLVPGRTELLLRFKPITTQEHGTLRGGLALWHPCYPPKAGLHCDKMPLQFEEALIEGSTLYSGYSFAAELGSDSKICLKSCEYEQAIIGPNRLLPGEYARFLQYCQSLRIIPAPLHQQAAAADQGSDEEDDTDRKPLPNDEAKAIIIPEFSQATESESQGGYNESRSTGYDDLHADMEKGSSGSDSVDYSECHVIPDTSLEIACSNRDAETLFFDPCLHKLFIEDIYLFRPDPKEDASPVIDWKNDLLRDLEVYAADFPGQGEEDKDWDGILESDEVAY